MEIRLLTPLDYWEKLLGWWKFWRFPAPPIDFLPGGGKDGLMVSVDGVDVCAGFLYLTNSKACWVEFIVSNHEVKDKVVRDEAIKSLIIGLVEMAKESGFEYIYSSIKNESLISKYIDCGFIEGSKNCTELIRKI